MNENVLICVAVLKPNHFYIVVIKKMPVRDPES